MTGPVVVDLDDDTLRALIAGIIRRHQPATGMKVAMGETCGCGYWNGDERPGVDRPVGLSGLMWHQSQEIAVALRDVGTPATTEPAFRYHEQRCRRLGRDPSGD